MEYQLIRCVYEGRDFMQGKRKEIRTPQEHLLMFVLLEKEGKLWIEFKNHCKTDYVELGNMISMLSKFQNQ